MRSPLGLAVTVGPGSTPGPPSVVFVHGSLDRGASFRRVARRLPDLATLTYDRRGYQASRCGGVGDLGTHIADLLSLAAWLREVRGGPLAAVGHSFGGDVVIGAALASPRAFNAVGAYEPPLPWFGFRPPQELPDEQLDRGLDPSEEVERCFRAVMGPAAWSRLSRERRQSLLADGPALVADIASLHGPRPPFDVTTLELPAVFGHGGPSSAPHHRAGVRWLAAHVHGATLVEFSRAGHGAHLSHPDRFTAFTRLVANRAEAP